MKNFVLLLLLAYSCAPKTTSLEEQRAGVMDIHDEAMAKMGEIRKYVSELEEIEENDSLSTDISDIIDELEAADEGMMIWMQEYKEPEAEKLETFYRSEKIKIQKVADAIYKSIENAKKHLKE